MSGRILLFVALALLTYGLWLSADFQQIAAGVAVFLFGMLALEEGFKTFTGGTLEDLLRGTTDRLWKSLSFGLVTTTLMQSSSLVSVIAISFLSAGLIGLTAGIGIIFGANLGTTTGGWLIAGLGLRVNIGAYAMPLLVFGVILLLQRHRTLKGIGYALTGVGLLFLGIHYMKEGFDAFKGSVDLASYGVPGLRGLLLFTLLGTAATLIMQSSHATLLVTITALASHQVTYENALALAIGANLGTTITAIIGSMGANIDGKRLAAAHLLFNLMTAVVAILLLRQLRWSVDLLSAQLGIAPADYTLKLALFHTLFNLLGVMLMVPFVDRLARLLERVIKVPEAAIDAPRYINEAALEVPAAAVEAIRKEIRRQYDSLRLELAIILREISEIASGIGDADTILSLDGAKIRLGQIDRRINLALTRLIRDKRITAYMATSLMNDCGYAYRIGRYLVDMAQILFAVRERRLKEAEQSLALDEAEIEKMINQRHRGRSPGAK